MYETVRSDDLNSALAILQRGGRAVSMVGLYDEEKASEQGVTATAQGTKVTTQALDELRELVEAGAVMSHVGRVFELGQIQEVLRARDAGSVRGKVVIKIR